MAVPDYYDAWDFADPGATRDRFLQALANLGDGPERDELLTQIARAEGLLGNREAAAASLDLAASGDDLRVHAAVALEQGRLARDAGETDAATELFAEAFDLASQARAEDLAVDAAHMLAAVVPGEPGIQWAHRGIRLAESSQVARAKAFLGPLFHNLGMTHLERKEYESALANFARALGVREQTGPPEALAVARWCIARALRPLGRHEEALVILRPLAVDAPEDGYVFEEIAENLAALGRHEEARSHYARAAELLADALADQPERWGRLRALSEATT